MKFPVSSLVLAIAIDENYNRSKLHASRTPETLKILKTSVVNQWKLFIPRWTVSNLSIFVAPICTTKRDIRRASSFPIGRRKSLVYPIRDPFLRAITKQISFPRNKRFVHFALTWENSELWNYLINNIPSVVTELYKWLNFIYDSISRIESTIEDKICGERSPNRLDKNIYICVCVVVEFLSEKRPLRLSRISRGWFISGLCCASRQIPIYTLTGRNNLLNTHRDKYTGRVCANVWTPKLQWDQYIVTLYL